MALPASGEEWFEVTTAPLSVPQVHDWAVRPDCGAVALFSGTVRDHAEGREGVVALEYEAYDEATVASFARIADRARELHPGARRIAIHHRTGRLSLGESAVVVAVSSAHRATAFDAARWIMDAVKESAPVWKKEHWAGGSDWGTNPSPIVDPTLVGKSS